MRKAVIVSGQFANHTLPVLIKIPLSYLSPFFRRLDFPIINNKLDLELELRGNACLIKDANVHASELVVTNTELYLPIVQLPSDVLSFVAIILHNKAYLGSYGSVCLQGHTKQHHF